MKSLPIRSRHLRWLILWMLLAIGPIGSTCVIVEEGPLYGYDEETPEERQEQDEVDELDGLE